MQKTTVKKLNIGSGKDIREGYVNLDFINLPGTDVVHNLNKYPWPFKKDTFDEVFCSHVLEHLDSVIQPMEEIWRITKNRGTLRVVVPITPSVWAFVDPTHKQFFTYLTFNYFRPNDANNYYSKARFNILERRIVFPNYFGFLNPLVNLTEFTQKMYFLFFSFIVPASMLYVELECVK